MYWMYWLFGVSARTLKGLTVKKRTMPKINGLINLIVVDSFFGSNNKIRIPRRVD